jgi:hypothetical protein
LYRDSLYVELGLHPPFSAFAKGPV